jgi:hypothetical protein
MESDYTAVAALRVAITVIRYEESTSMQNALAIKYHSGRVYAAGSLLWVMATSSCREGGRDPLN